MARPWSSDLIGVLKGAQIVANTLLKQQSDCAKKILDNSSVKSAASANLTETLEKLREIDPSKIPEKIYLETKEIIDRIYVVERGILEYTKHQTSELIDLDIIKSNINNEENKITPKLEIYNPAKDPREIKPTKFVDTVKTTADNLIDNDKLLNNKNIIDVPENYSTVKEKIETIGKLEKTIPKIQLTKKDKEVLRKLELEHEKKLENNIKNKSPGLLNVETTGVDNNDDKKINIKPKIKPTIKPKQTLLENARERKVPSTRIERLFEFGKLGVKLGGGTAAEYGRRFLGIKNKNNESLDSLFLTPKNAERIVSTLCTVRGKIFSLF